MSRKKKTAAEETSVSEGFSPGSTEGMSAARICRGLPSLTLRCRRSRLPLLPKAHTRPRLRNQNQKEHGSAHCLSRTVGTELTWATAEVARLFLSRRFNQNMIQFAATEQGVDPRPSKEDTEFLKANGWRWRSEEKAWTRQLDKNTDDNRYGRAKSDRAAEDQFVTLVNDIRVRNGLEPTGYDFGQDAPAAARG